MQVEFCAWLCHQYPIVLFDSDTIAAVKLTLPQGARNKKIQKPGFKRPDVFMFEPSGRFHGLALELKTESPFKIKGGALKSDEHLQGQAKTLGALVAKGYYATFVWSLEAAMQLTNLYMGKPELMPPPKIYGILP